MARPTKRTPEREQRLLIGAERHPSGKARSARPASCRHTRVEGDWISAAHAVRCLGVPRKQLLQVLFDDQIRFRIVGQGHKRCIQVWAADLAARWPKKLGNLGSLKRARTTQTDTTDTPERARGALIDVQR